MLYSLSAKAPPNMGGALISINRPCVTICHRFLLTGQGMTVSQHILRTLLAVLLPVALGLAWLLYSGWQAQQAGMREQLDALALQQQTLLDQQLAHGKRVAQGMAATAWAQALDRRRCPQADMRQWLLGAYGFSNAVTLDARGELVCAVLPLDAPARQRLRQLPALLARQPLPVSDPILAPVSQHEAVLVATPLGAVMEWRLTALAAVVAAAIVPLNVLRTPVLALSGSVALCSIVLTGHAGASEAVLHRWADGLHLLAAALWLGALAAFLGAALRNDSDTRALARFAGTGSAVVAVLVVTGAVNTLAIAGWPIVWASFAHSRWAALLAVKLVLFVVMLALAADNRWRIVPALEQGEQGAQARLRRSILVEFTVGLAIVVIVAALGVLDPAA